MQLCTTGQWTGLMRHPKRLWKTLTKLSVNNYRLFRRVKQLRDLGPSRIVTCRALLQQVDLTSANGRKSHPDGNGNVNGVPKGAHRNGVNVTRLQLSVVLIVVVAPVVSSSSLWSLESCEFVN